jgi:hypothetical protein
MMDNQGSPFGISSFCRTIGLFFHKNGVRELTIFREPLSDLTTRCPETPLTGHRNRNETVQPDRTRAGPFPLIAAGKKKP